MKQALTAVFLAFLAACASAPRTSTEEERATADAMVAIIETGVTVAAAAGKLTDAQVELATQQIVTLRADIANSANVPVSWVTILQRIANLSVQWLPRREP